MTPTINRATRIADELGLDAGVLAHIEDEVFERLLQSALSGSDVAMLRALAGGATVPDGYRADGRPVADLVPDVLAFARAVQATAAGLAAAIDTAMERRQRLIDAVGWNRE